MFSYHIKDSFFIEIEKNLGKNTNLMSNKENEGYRLHFLCIQDKENTNIYWAVPQSTKVEKYKEEIDKKLKKYSKCDTIKIGIFAGRENAFLIQNMFPVTAEYIDHIHTVNNIPVSIHPDLEKEIISSVKRVLALNKKGIKLTFTQINQIYDFLKGK